MLRIARASTLLAALLAASGTGDRRVELTTIEGISAYTCANGLKVLLAPDTSRETVTVSITYFVGSRHETYGQTGIAHLLEHMLFSETRSHPDVSAELDARGGDGNAATGADSTMYYETVPARNEDVEWALQLEADRMAHAVIMEDRLRSEAAVVRSELAMDEDDPVSALQERLFSAAYTWHNYGKGVGGAHADLQGIRADPVLRFYRSHYRPDNALLVIAGAIDIASAIGAVDRTFRDIAAPGSAVLETHTVEPAQQGARTVQLHRPNNVQQIQIGYHIPPPSHSDFAAIQVLVSLLGEGPYSALHESLVRTRIATSVFGFATFRRDPGLVVFGADMPPGGSGPEALAAMLEVLERRGSSFSDSDVTVEKLRARNDMSDTLRAGERFAQEIGDWATTGDWRLFFLHRDRLERVTTDDVTRVARKYLVATNRTVAELIPDDSAPVSIDAADDLSEALAAYKGRGAPAAGVSRDVKSRVTQTRLSSGLKVALLPRSSRAKQVHAVLNLRLGSAESLVNRTWAGRLTAKMLLRGTRFHTSKQIRKALAETEADVTISAGPQVVTAWFTTTREHLVRVLSLVVEALRYPALLDTDFDEVQRAALLSARAEGGSPEWTAWSTINRALHAYPPGDIRRSPSAGEKIAAITHLNAADARRFHADFYGASSGELAVVGDFDPDGLLQTAESAVRDWPSPLPFRPATLAYRENAPSYIQVRQPGRHNSIFEAGLAIPIDQNALEYPALLLGVNLMGGGFLNSRLPTRMRRHDGLTYWVESALVGSATDRVVTFLTTAACEPQNLAKVRSAFLAELRRSLDEGFGETEVDTAKRSWLRGQQIATSRDADLAAALAVDLFADRPTNWRADLQRRVASLSTAEVNAAWRKHIKAEEVSVVEAGDIGHP